MPGQEIARQWFIPGEGIDRHVISADIQRYLGNDATVRPGQGTGENQGVSGYWIKAYRNLTSAMIADLRADSARWRQEQRMTGTREPYVGSRTYEASSAARQAQRRDGDSPSLDGGYGVPPSSRQGRGQPDAMQIDPPVAQPGRGYGQPSQPTRGYQPDNGVYPPQGRERERDRYAEPGRAYQQDQPMSDAYSRMPTTTAYGQDPRYATAPAYPQNDGAPPGYVREGNYYVPITSSYGQPNILAQSRPEPQQYPSSGTYGQPQVPPGRDPREQRGDPRDPRYGGQSEYDPRYAYPSPATTVTSMAPSGREPISSPQQPSLYGQVPPPQYEQYGRPVQTTQNPYGSPDSGYVPTARDPNYGRETRQPAAPPTSDRDRDSRRRRLH